MPLLGATIPSKGRKKSRKRPISRDLMKKMWSPDITTNPPSPHGQCWESDHYDRGTNLVILHFGFEIYRNFYENSYSDFTWNQFWELYKVGNTDIYRNRFLSPSPAQYLQSVRLRKDLRGRKITSHKVRRSRMSRS